MTGYGTRREAAIRKTLQTEGALNRLKSIGGEVMPNSPKEEHDKVAKEVAVWTNIWKRPGWRNNSVGDPTRDQDKPSCKLKRFPLI
jgi:hypothetical protein